MGRGTVRIDPNQLDIRSGHPVQLARNELLANWGHPEAMGALNGVLAALPKGTLKQQSQTLLHAAEKAGEGTEAYYANRMALTIIRRAEYIEQQREEGKSHIKKVLGDDGLNAQIAQAIERTQSTELSALDTRSGVPSTRLRPGSAPAQDVQMAGGGWMSAQAAEMKPQPEPRKPGLLQQALADVVKGDDAKYRAEVQGALQQVLSADPANSGSYAAKKAILQTTIEDRQAKMAATKDMAEVWQLDTQVRAYTLASKVLDRHEQLRKERGDLKTTAVAAAAPTAPAAPDGAPAPTIVPGTTDLTREQKQSIQFDLEALGLPTGQPGGFDAAKGAEGMDGVFGKVTRPSLAKFLEDNKLATLDEAAIAKLHALAEAKRTELAAGKEAAPATTTAATTAAPATTTAPAVSATALEQIASIRTLFTELNVDGLDRDEKLKLQGNLEKLQGTISAPEALTGDVKTQLGSVLVALKDTGNVQDADEVLGQTVKTLRTTVEQART